MHTHIEEKTKGHSHTHNPEDMKAIINRIAKAVGHLESVKRMVEDGRDSSEVWIELAAVKSAINNTGKEILKEHISHCIIDAVKSGDEAAVEELNHAIDQFMK